MRVNYEQIMIIARTFKYFMHGICDHEIHLFEHQSGLKNEKKTEYICNMSIISISKRSSFFVSSKID